MVETARDEDEAAQGGEAAEAFQDRKEVRQHYRV